MLIYNKETDGEIFITNQVYTSNYDQTINKKDYGTSNIEISNITFDCNRSNVGLSVKETWIKITDCNNVIIKGLRFNSEEVINEYPKAIFINESNNVSVTECYSTKVPMLQMRCCKKMKANNNTAQVSGVMRTLGRNSLKGQKAPSPGHRPGYKDMGKLALQGHKLYHASLCFCPFRAPCCASYLPRAMPWAGSFPAFQALSSGTSET